jgi:methyltransferase (TIGR00027 family)
MLTPFDTAFSIAAVRDDERLLPVKDRLFDDPYAGLFRAAGAHAEEGTKRFLALPFFKDGIRLRTRFIDDVLGKALEDGIDQIVLLGAGFDARAFRIPAIIARELASTRSTWWNSRSPVKRVDESQRASR